jgi:lactam utilization protein B
MRVTECDDEESNSKILYSIKAINAFVVIHLVHMDYVTIATYLAAEILIKNAAVLMLMLFIQHNALKVLYFFF